MNSSRTKNAKRNIMMSYINMVVSLAFQLVSRTAIVHILGSEYLGLSSLFTSVLQVLSLADLGFAGAITYNLYKPIAKGDDKSICALLEYYKKIYQVVGIVIFIAGMLVMPFIKFFISGTIPVDLNLYALYLLYLLNTVVSYFVFAYKSTLLEALQRNDILKNIYTIVGVVQYGLQIFVLFIFENFYLFIIVSIIATIFKNITAEWVTKKKYPQYACVGIIASEVKKDIISRVKGLLVCNISGKTYTTLDSIIISTFIGLEAVAIYNNYLVVFNVVTACIVAIRAAMQAGIGNKIAIESVDDNYKDVFVWQFVFSVIATWCASCMLCIYQPFMKFWMGNKLLLPTRDVVLFCIWILISEVQHAFFLYLSGNGLWWELRWPYILSTVQNLVLNIFLGKMFGVTGVIISSILASFIFGLLWQCIIIFKCYFKRTPIEFYKRQAKYYVVSFVVCVISFWFCSNIGFEGIAAIILDGIICTLISATVMYFCYRKLDVYRRACSIVKVK